MMNLLFHVNIVGSYVAQDPAATTPTQDLFPVWVQVIAIGLLIIAVLWIIKLFLGDVITAIFAKTKSVHATLISKSANSYVNKKVYMSGNASGNGVASGIAEKGIDYELYFQLDDGTNVSLFVPKDTYDISVEDSSGTLTYKGKVFISYDGITEGTRIRTDSMENSFVGINKQL